MKIKLKSLTILISFCTLFFSCDGSEDGPQAPANLNFNVQVSNDFSGKVTFTATADNATNFAFFPGEDPNGLGIESTTGQIEYTYKKSGTYTARVFAYATETLFISETAEVIVETDIASGTYLLLWSDEFDTPGAPNSDNWGYDIGTGQDGWGNNESQYYTDRSENVIVEDGLLKIIAKREDFEGSSFTSTRLLSQDKVEFTYGLIEIRAKLPKGGGTWPALWLLGADIGTVGWPACGEIDIMEQTGNNKAKVSAALHSPASFGATVNFRETDLETATDEFHVYGAEWTEDYISFTIDSTEFYRFIPNSKNANDWPFAKDFFLILNVAVGGTLGGQIANDFNEGIMEIDYVRVYQQ